MRLGSAILLFGAATGCVGPGKDFSHAAATNGCGPTDGPATTIVLAQDPIESVTQPPLPHVRVGFWVSVDALVGTWDITTDLGPGTWYVVGPNSFGESARSGRILVTSVDSAKTITGSVELHFPSRTVLTDFTATWVERLVLCG